MKITKFLGLEIKVNPDIPKGTIMIVPPRKIIEGKLESLDDWAKRSVKIKKGSF